MKVKIYFSLFVILAITISFVIKPGKNISNALEPGIVNSVYDSIPFIIGVYNNGAGDTSGNMKKLFTDTLNLNLWHKFIDRRGDTAKHSYQITQGWKFADSLYYPDNNNVNFAVKDILDSNGTSLRTLMYRPKIEWLFFAQRSDYQCVAKDFLKDPTYNWFYTYDTTGGHKGNDIEDNSQFGNGVRVRYCSSNNPDGRDSGYVVKKLISNREQINTGNPGHGGHPYPGFGDGQFKWYVKPRIRIDSTFAANPSNDNVKICRIEVLNYDGNIISVRDIKVINFKQYIGATYHGNYLEKYVDYNSANDTANTIIQRGWDFNPHDSDWTKRDGSCKADFRVFWYGKCDMWINYVRVDDERANDLFGDTLTNSNSQLYRDMIKLEARTAKYNNSPIMFYIDEFEFNHIPAITYVMKKLQQYGGTTGMPFVLCTNLPAGHEQWYELHLPSNDSLKISHFKQYCLDSCKVALYGLSNSYPFYAYDDNLNYKTKLPSSLPNVTGNYILANIVTPGEYESWLQSFIDGNGLFITKCKQLQYITSLKPELHTFFSIQAFEENHNDSHGGVGGVREPTIEETNMMVNTALSYGMKGIIYYWYGAFGQDPNGNVNIDDFSVGLTNRFGYSAPLTPRYYNFYGQEKWNSIIRTDTILKKWGPVLIKFNQYYTNSFIYNNSSERSSFLSGTYFQDIITYKPGSGNPPCSEDNPGGSPPAGLIYECNYERYLQAATFKENTSDINRYFMIVNRRCSPYRDSTSADNRGGRRNVRIKFDANSSDFANFNNWEIIDLFNNSTIVTFDKRASSLLDLGWYMPGEGKLYKIVPVMVEGGTLVCDEAPAPGSFTCDSIVFNNGYNITLYPSTTISFNPNGKIVMNGGNFITGSYASNQSPPPHVILKGNSNQWEGLSFTNCNNIEIGTTDFSDICYILNDTIPHNNSAIDIINCFNFTISGNNFDQNTPANAIHILIDNCSSEWSNAYLGYNNFYYSSNSQSSINVYSLAAGVTPLYICNNNLINDEQPINTPAMIINGVTGGTIRNNIITNFTYGIKMLASTIDLFNNYIYSNIESSDGFFGSSGSNVNMTPNLGYYTGGNNHIVTANSSGKNINVNNSFFNIKLGGNLFNISSSSNSYHMYGTFPDGNHSVQEAQSNCFQEDSIYVYPVYQLYWGETADTVEFKFGNTVCEDNPSQDYEVFTFSNANNDTVYKTGTGSGGGMKGFGIEQMNTESNYSKIYDSLNINVRKRNYPLIETQSKYLLTNYPDSVKTLSAINWLYYAIISRDSITNRMTLLKTYYETLILNNSNNEALIDRGFYFIQKCKVALKQYQSAMAGFQSIMNEHPYSFEGLVASWDYAATHLLDSLGGTGGGVKNQILNIKNKKLGEENLNFEGENELLDLEFYLNSFMSNYDSTKFKKSDRVSIINNTRNSFERKKVKDIEIIKNLKSRSEKGDKTAIRELQTKKAINEAVKVKKPRTQIELKNIISNDINKIFARVKETENKETNIIPKEFVLYQNYPNPFNPTTKISFDLPKDAKVKLIVYDILGREITRLLNSEFKQAGKHIIEFDAMKYNLASGVYFYRIESGDYNAVKKMLMIK